MRRVILHPPTLSRATLPPPFRESALGFSLHRFAPVQHFGIAYGSRSCQPQLSFIVSTIYDSVYTNGSGGNGYRTTRISEGKRNVKEQARRKRLRSVGIEVRVTNEIPVVSTESNAVRDVVPPWTTTSAPSRTSPTTPTNPHSQFLSPHVFHGRNSLCSANDYTRRRRPMTLRIGPRLSLPSKSTSAPTTTTDGEWRALREYIMINIPILIINLPSAVPQLVMAQGLCFIATRKICLILHFQLIIFILICKCILIASVIQRCFHDSASICIQWHINKRYLTVVRLSVCAHVQNSMHSKSLSIDGFVTVRIIRNQVKRSGVDCDKGIYNSMKVKHVEFRFSEDYLKYNKCREKFLRAVSFAQSSIGDRASTGIHAMMMKCDEKKREMFSRRACSESGPHPGIPGYGNVPVSGHLWGKRNQGRTSAPIVGHARPPAIILRTRRSWPVAPTHCRSVVRLRVLIDAHSLKWQVGLLRSDFDFHKHNERVSLLFQRVFVEFFLIPVSVQSFCIGAWSFSQVNFCSPILAISLLTDPNRAIVGKFLSEKKIFQLKCRVIQSYSTGLLGLDYIDSLLKISLHTLKSIFIKIELHLSIALVSPASFSSYSTRNVISGCNCRVL
ncbi:hypothetical protein ALC53_13872 [Atta colombica]|uniref:Uncharacterized protein n=1 Tax=Atta colombica TaxID=520822 RepID=A0A195AUR9_9HYME|nr:hypothetical protein ALC53_13872 [Atta colombica]